MATPSSHEESPIPHSKRNHGLTTPGNFGLVVEVKAGSAVAFDGQLWHTGSRNNTPELRRALFAYCGPYWMKRMDEFFERPLPDYVAKADDARVRQLFGLELSTVSVHGESYRKGHPAFV